MPAPAPSPLLLTSFGELLRYLRRRARLTQRELSIAVGYSESQISRLEKNQRLPDLAALLALFVPVLDLEDEPEIVARLLELATAARGEALPQSVTFTRAVKHEFTEEVSTFEEPPPGNLPRPLTTFIGREREMAEVRRLLASSRLVTLAGPGGGGKTRLALEVAAQLQTAYRHGVWLVELAPLSDAALVPPAAAAVLDVQVEAGRPLLPALTAYLHPRHLLLLLDNCEHVVTAAAQLAEKLLQACPHLRLVATSREVLDVPGETIFQVPPLPLPDPADLHSLDALSHYEAVQLFVERAQSALPGFALTAENAPLPSRYAGGWTASRWPSSWRRPGPGYCASRKLPPGWTNVFACWPTAAARRCPGTGCCARPSTGATICWQRTSRRCCGDYRSLPAAGRWRRRRQ